MNKRNTIQRSWVLRAVKAMRCHVTAEEVYDTLMQKMWLHEIAWLSFRMPKADAGRFIAHIAMGSNVTMVALISNGPES